MAGNKISVYTCSMEKTKKRTKKQEEHTGFRNGDLFCFHCGRSQKIPYPMDVRIAADLMLSFAKHHKACTKTWVEPHWSETASMATTQEKMNWWRNKGEHGTSSELMYRFISSGYRNLGSSSQYENIHPSDPSDFRRCYILIKAIPEWRENLDLMKQISPTWSNIVDNWDKLCSMLEELVETHKDNGMYDFMKSIGC